MPNVNPEGNDGSLSLAEAVSAYTKPEKDEETGDGHAEPDQEAEGDEADEPLEEEGEETGEPDEEGQAEEDEQTEEPAAPAYVAAEAKVKLPDGSEATVADLIQGNLRDRDYRQKTEAVANERKAVAAKSEEIQQLEQQISGDRQYMSELLTALMPPKPDANMASVDPVGYVEAKARYEAFKEHADYLFATQSQAAQRRQTEQQDQLKELRTREWEATLREMPELKDTKRLQSFVTDVNQHGTHYGFTNLELQNISLDHRQALVLRDAIAWRKLQASKSKAPAKVEGRPPVQRGGTRQSPEAQRSRDARVAMERLNSSGSLRDGVKALLALEKG
jgi:hypothetical protein